MTTSLSLQLGSSRLRIVGAPAGPTRERTVRRLQRHSGEIIAIDHLNGMQKGGLATWICLF